MTADAGRTRSATTADAQKEGASEQDDEIGVVLPQRAIGLVLSALPLVGIGACAASRARPSPPAAQPTPSVASAQRPRVQSAKALVVTNALRHELWVLYTDARVPEGVHPDEIRGPVRGSVRYAYIPATRTYWAIADFALTDRATEQTRVNSQEGTLGPFFHRKVGGQWVTEAGENLQGPCGDGVPAAALRAWGMCGLH
jgi:hypothetical protein